MTDNIYDVFNRPPEAEAGSQKEQPRLSKEEWMAKKQAERDGLFGDIASMFEQIQHDPQALQIYLTVQSRFPYHSVNNALLITMQDRNAQKIGDFDYWKKQGGSVMKGPKAIFIFEPAGQYERADGTLGTNIGVKRVYDISQTNLRPTPPIRYTERTKLQALIQNCAAQISIVADTGYGNPAVLYQPEQDRILVTQNLSPDELFAGIAQESAHLYFAAHDRAYDRHTYDQQAVCTAFMLCRKNQVNTAAFDLAEVSRSLAGMEQKEVNAFLTEAKQAAQTVSKQMDQVYAAVRQDMAAQRGQDHGR